MAEFHLAAWIGSISHPSTSLHCLGLQGHLNTAEPLDSALTFKYFVELTALNSSPPPCILEFVCPLFTARSLYWPTIPRPRLERQRELLWFWPTGFRILFTWRKKNENRVSFNTSLILSLVKKKCTYYWTLCSAMSFGCTLTFFLTTSYTVLLLNSVLVGASGNKSLQGYSYSE